MAIVTLSEAKSHLGVTGDADDDLITAKIEAAQAHLESWLGYMVEARFGQDSPPSIPADLKEAVLSLTAHLYENREASLVGLSISTVPLSVRDIIAARRDYFGVSPDVA